MKASYSEQDPTYGATMLTLRTGIGLTQAGLANLLGVSRRAVGDWEAGNSYPKAEHLKELITLAVKNQAFTTGNVAQEIRALWKAAHQKVLLDESWLSSLIEHAHSPYLHIVPKPVGESATGAPIDKQEPRTAPTVSRTRVDWSDALVTPVFYGREQESAQLTQWIVQEQCHVVSVLGMGGIGKTALSVSIMHQLAVGTADRPCPFEVVIFRSLRDAPSCEALLADCLQVLSPQSQEGKAVETEPCAFGSPTGGMYGQAQGKGAVGTGLAPVPSPKPTPTERRISLLLEHLRAKRALLVLDNMESLLEAGDIRGRFRPGFEEYGHLLCRVAETVHKSCLLFTSREKPAALRPLEGKYSPVRSLRLKGLNVPACKKLLMEKGIAPELTPGAGTEKDAERLIEIYEGNPLALKIVAEIIVDLFGGEISPFLTGETVLFGSITDLIAEQFARLSALEQSVLYWLAIAREPITLDELVKALVPFLPHVQVLEAVDACYRRTLIERGNSPGSVTLQSVVLEYVTTVLIAEGSHEIQQHQLERLIQHGFSQAHAKESVRQTQERLLLSPLLMNLQNLYLQRADGAPRSSATATGPTPLEVQLLSLLDELRELADSTQGYGPTNLITLLRLQRENLNGLNLSKLCIRGASLQGIQMQNASLAGALIRDTVFTEAVSATWNVAISKDGTLWAASGMQGKIRIWEEGSRTSHLIWQAHSDMVQALAFSPNGRMLASGSRDGTVKLWDLEKCSHGDSPRDTLLWIGWQNSPQMLAFSPDGSLLASSGLGTLVQLWDTKTGTNLQSLVHPFQVFAITWSPDGRLLASTCFDGQLRLWERQEAQPRPGTEILLLSTNWEASPLWSLAFAPDSRILVSVGWEDRKIKLWEAESGRLLHTFAGETSKANRVVWSPDGHTLASCSHEKAIRLWDVEQRRHRATLSGHTSNINSVAFTPDSNRLLSSGDDGTLRVWDVKSGECVRVMVSYALSYYSLDWSPDGQHLVSSGTDGLVIIWNLSTQTPPRELHGHTCLVGGVGWSPDGRFVASCGWDMVTRLWNPTSGACVQSFQDPVTTLLGIAWSPDGSSLAVGTWLQGMYVWDVKESRPRWIGEPNQTAFLSAAWSPDGSLLAGGSDDGSVYLWESRDGTRRKRLSGHHGNVMSLAWSPDGRFLASGSGNSGRGELFVWDVQTYRNGDAAQELHQPQASRPCQPIQILVEHPDIVYAVAWSRRRDEKGASPFPTSPHPGADPGGDRLISGGSDGILRWWDVQSGECVGMQEACHGTIRSLKVSPDEKFLASCGDDGAIMIWDCASHEHLRTLRRDRPYERLNITGIRGLTEAQKSTLQALGAIEDQL